MKTRILFATLAAAALATTGCSSMHPNRAQTETVQPQNVTGEAGTTSTGIDSTGNPTKGTSSGVPAGKAANPDEPPGIESGTTRDVAPENLDQEGKPLPTEDQQQPAPAPAPLPEDQQPTPQPTPQ